FAEGKHRQLGRCFGAQPWQVDGVHGVRFVVWAPNARRVSVVGNFNSWDGRRHPMRLHPGAGIWEIVIPRLEAGEVYKYEVLGREGLLPLKADPVALQTEHAPPTGSVVAGRLDVHWDDAQWRARREPRQGPARPLAIYEVHAGSWRHTARGDPLSWAQLADHLVPHVTAMGSTRSELLPVTGPPFGGYWG